MNAYRPLEWFIVRRRGHVHPPHRHHDRTLNIHVNGEYICGTPFRSEVITYLRARLTDPSTGAKVIRVLIRKEQPFELHVVVNPTDKLDVPKLEESGSYHVGDFDGDKQIDEAVSAVSVYLELEESSVK